MAHARPFFRCAPTNLVPDRRYYQRYSQWILTHTLVRFKGAELREIQKQINHLENPHDPQEVSKCVGERTYHEEPDRVQSSFYNLEHLMTKLEYIKIKSRQRKSLVTVSCDLLSTTFCGETGWPLFRMNKTKTIILLLFLFELLFSGIFLFLAFYYHTPLQTIRNSR